MNYWGGGGGGGFTCTTSPSVPEVVQNVYSSMNHHGKRINHRNSKCPIQELKFFSYATVSSFSGSVVEWVDRYQSTKYTQRQ